MSQPILRRYVDDNNLLDPFHSAYFPHNITETALCIHDDITHVLDRRKGVVLVRLDLTAALAAS